MQTPIHERVHLARQGKNPTVICKVPSGWVVMGDSQFLKGYCLLLPDPVVPSLNDLGASERISYLRDMSLIGDAVLKTCGAYRINYEILGNTDPALHAHVFPRYLDEPEKIRKAPVWFQERNTIDEFDVILHGDLKKKLKEAIEAIFQENKISL